MIKGTTLFVLCPLLLSLSLSLFGSILLALHPWAFPRSFALHPPLSSDTYFAQWPFVLKFWPTSFFSFALSTKRHLFFEKNPPHSILFDYIYPFPVMLPAYVILDFMTMPCGNDNIVGFI
jgi:hypothetical protein